MEIGGIYFADPSSLKPFHFFWNLKKILRIYLTKICKCVLYFTLFKTFCLVWAFLGKMGENRPKQGSKLKRPEEEKNGKKIWM